MYTFHLECPCFEQPSEHRRVEAVAQLAREVRAAGMNVGLALSPDTSIARALPYLEVGDFDLVASDPNCHSFPFYLIHVKQLASYYMQLYNAPS